MAAIHLTALLTRSRYEKQIDNLTRELEMRGGPHGAPHHPPQPQPPAIGHGPRDLFVGIMQGGGGQGQSSLAPPPQEPQQPQGMPPHLTQNSGLSTGPQPPQHQPYPYPTGVNGTPHAGHAFTASKLEFAIGWARMQERELYIHRAFTAQVCQSRHVQTSLYARWKCLGRTSNDARSKR